MTLRRPRTVFALAVGLLLVVLALFVAALLNARADDREQADKRFQDKARVSAALTESLFASTASQGAQQQQQRFGDARIDQDKLERTVKESRLAYSIILNDKGVPIAMSNGTPRPVLERITRGTPATKAVLGGQSYSLTGVQDDSQALEYVSAFKSDAGDRRIAVQGFSAALIGAFLGGYLADLPDTGNARAYVLDERHRVVGSPVKGQPPASLVREPGLVNALERSASHGHFDGDGDEQVFTKAPVAQSTWNVVLAEKAKTLYADTGSMLEWLILVTLAVAGIAALALLRRTLRTAEDLAGAYERLAISNVDLERSNVELKRSNAELEQFASVASHDLQEPLRKVQTFGDQLERRFGDEIPDEAKDYLRRMRRAANRMSTLIEDLLRFSRVTTHARPPRQVDLEQVAREVTADLDALLAETHGSVEVGTLPKLQADPLQMRQLMQNLIGNGLKFHRPGQPPIVRVDGAPTTHDGDVAFTVTDDGIGFEPVYAERIFRVFERLHPRDVYAGTGIGLALCRKIVERHGGTITAEGRPDHGATFTVTLPRVQPELPASQSDRPSADDPQTPLEAAHA
jgi:signal transduction histidine kinase